MSTARVLRWNIVSLAGRQLVQVASSILLARLLGPDQYGLTTILSVYAALTLIVLDQGLASALIQKPELNDREPGASSTLNIVLALVLGGATSLCAGAVAGFFHTPQLAPMLVVLGAGLVLKGLAIVPRAMLSRQLEFRPVAQADLVGSLLGAATGVVVAWRGGGAWSIVVQVLLTDAVVAVVLLVACRGPVPNLSMGALRGLFRFSASVFGSSLLANIARRIDDILVGHHLGPTQLGYYSLGYKVLLLPVQLLSGVLNRALFPLIARRSTDAMYVRRLLRSSTLVLSGIAFPGMALVALCAPVAVPAVFGTDWAAAVPVVQILAVTGARQCVFSVTSTLMIGVGKADWQLRFAIVAVSTQVLGIVVGLQFGIVGVALGYTIAGFVVTPLMISIQRRLTGVSWKQQLGLLVPAVHAVLWASAGFVAVQLLDVRAVGLTVVSAAVFVGLYLGVLVVFHRSFVRSFSTMARSLLSRAA
jgi:PST family polysaccharide transporter